MIQLNAVFFVLLLEGLLLLLGLSSFLAWRLLRKPRAALSTPEDVTANARRFLESELMRTKARLQDEVEPGEDRHLSLERRREAMEAELDALNLIDSESAYWERVEAGYEAGSPAATEGDVADSDRDPAVADEPPEDANAALAALKADYEALLAALHQAELQPDVREQVDTATSNWYEKLIVIERQLRRSGYALVGMSSGNRPPDDAGLSGTGSSGANGDRDRLRQIIGQQDELIWDLKKDMASAISDSEKLKHLEGRVEEILRQARELQACVNVLEDENNFLFQQLRERDDQAESPQQGDEFDRTHLGFLVAGQQEALETLDAAIEALEASGANQTETTQARSALSELIAGAQSLQSTLVRSGSQPQPQD